MPTNSRLRCAESIGNMLPLASTLVVLSYRFQVAPPFMEIKKPTPGLVTTPGPVLSVLPSPVAAMRIDWLGLLLRPNTVILPMLRLEVAPKFVSGIYVGPLGLVVKKSVVFQIPPLAPATYTVL